MSNLHLRALPYAIPEPIRELFLIRTNGDASPACSGPYQSREDAAAAAKAMKADYLSSRVLIVMATAEVHPIPDPLVVVEL